jgi:transposase
VGAHQKEIKKLRNPSCKKCGHTENANWNTAKNIALRAVINQPIVLCPGNWDLEAKSHSFSRGQLT